MIFLMSPSKQHLYQFSHFCTWPTPWHTTCDVCHNRPQ